MARYRTVTRETAMEKANARLTSNSGSTSVKIPSDFGKMEYFKVSKEVHNLDVIGYIITDENHPEGIEPGHLWSFRKYFAHRNIGSAQNSYVCPARTWNKKCPICEYARAGKNNGTLTKKELDELNPKQRMLLCVIDRDAGDDILLWDVSYHLFGKMLDKELKDCDESDAYRFFEPDGGFFLRCRFNKRSFQGNDFWECDRIDFKKRSKNYPESILDEVPPLDDVLIEFTYEQLESIFVMGDEAGQESSNRTRDRDRNESDDTDDRTSRRRRRESSEDEQEPERTGRRGRREEPEEEQEPERRPRRGSEDRDDEPPARRGRREEPEPEPEERRPRRTREPEPEDEERRPSRRREPEPEDEPEERRPRRGGRNADPEPEPEDPPARRPSRGGRDSSDDKNKCPEGFVFGDDNDKEEACDSCKIWGACNAQKRKRG